MRVVHVVSAIDPQYGGPTTAVLGLALAQQQLGMKVVISATHHFPILDTIGFDALRSHGATVNLTHYQPNRVGILGEYRAQLEKDVRDADVVHIHALWNSEQHLGAKIAQKWRRPFLFRPCGMLAPWSMQRGRLKKLLYLVFRLKWHFAKASAIHFTTVREREDSKHLCGKCNFIVEPNGIERREFQDLFSDQQKGKNFYEEFDWYQGQPILLFLGRIHPKKGVEFLIRAIAQVKEGVLVVAGPEERSYGLHLREMVRELGIESRVRFIGSLDSSQRLRAYRDAKLFGLTSYHENFGNSVIESLGSGTPVLISDKVDLCEDLYHVEFASIVSLQQDAVNAAVSQRMTSSFGMEQRSACREFAFQKFSWSEIASRWDAHYKKIRKTYGESNQT